MIGSLRGLVVHVLPGQLLLEVQGVGYEISMPVGAYNHVSKVGEEAMVYISESMGMYGGGTTLYGFLTLEDKEIFGLLREIPGTGAKKALDYLDKISKSAPDFRRAVLDGDARSLVSLFGFTKKTADKIIVALREKVAGLKVAGRQKFSGQLLSPGLGEALAALVSLGYRETEARSALERLGATGQEMGETSQIVREALKQLS